ncbi:methionyl aminopeptidase [Pseudolactococcus raffinolactis]|jgi:methionyl aminopeptidase|uniref:Methionine aminopeptidase n=1 Tax=Pseudolactococcus raffinolactis TaxID=1366 RepID=A0A290QAK9_9LACT|nr:methionyl aminopeptidase [Lactococcus raffinolactis]MBR2542418.1 methionyl aminopeptidase [Lactococcus sp.]ATC60952.1 methionine aminopeptidase [Lactococcus raffinolactis]MDG4962119.1 methionyl aminopeptidase [Lactococcus raffinolactis]MDN5413761.1 methionyl aminopeptidase [Lactococcus raffinolactis]MDN5468016.1 methionyl aminopeptidase [Lactococcus raffinolactis]
MITLKSPREIAMMQDASDVLASIHIGLRDIIKPGVDMWEIESYVRRICKEKNAIPLQIGVDEGNVDPYPYATCCCLNDEVAHSFPRKGHILKSGDLIKVDMVIGTGGGIDMSKANFDDGMAMKALADNFTGGVADSCWAYAVGEVSDEVKQLMAVTKESLYRGIEAAQVGNRIGDIGHAIQSYAESFGYGVVRDLVGHGVGPTMHEDPLVPHYGTPGKGLRLREGMVLTIEPMINTGDWEIDHPSNERGYTTFDGSLSCQYEHQFVVTKNGPVILTSQGEEGTY